jgi:hypothetical protein
MSAGKMSAGDARHDCAAAHYPNHRSDAASERAMKPIQPASVGDRG